MKYDNLTMMSNKDLHKDAFKIVSRYVKKTDNILVLGSGQGSFELRLLDNGYKNITASDAIYDNFRLHDRELSFVTCDYDDGEFHKKFKKYDAVIALVIIEHVQSPYAFLESCKQMLKKGGVLFVATPNPQDAYARINNLIFGYPTLFVYPPKKYGHISPIFDNVFNHYLDLLNLVLIKRYPVSSFMRNKKVYSWKSLPYYYFVWLLRVLLSPFMLFNKKLLKGLDNFYVIKKK